MIRPSVSANWCLLKLVPTLPQRQHDRGLILLDGHISKERLCLRKTFLGYRRYIYFSKRQDKGLNNCKFSNIIALRKGRSGAYQVLAGTNSTFFWQPGFSQAGTQGGWVNPGTQRQATRSQVRVWSSLLVLGIGWSLRVERFCNFQYICQTSNYTL